MQDSMGVSHSKVIFVGFLFKTWNWIEVELTIVNNQNMKYCGHKLKQAYFLSEQ